MTFSPDQTYKRPAELQEVLADLAATSKRLDDGLQSLVNQIGASPAPDSREACAPSYKDLPAVPLSKGQLP